MLTPRAFHESCGFALVTSSTSQSKQLLLCCTPLQCRVSLYLIQQGILSDFDFVYIAYSNSSTVTTYYDSVAELASTSFFLKPRKQKFTIISNLLFVGENLYRINSADYSEVFLASIDHVFFRSILALNKSLLISTFDDGLANIDHPGLYHGSDYKWRDHLYDYALKLLFSIPTSSSIILKISRHFTIYDGIQNIAPRSKLHFVPIFNDIFSGVSLMDQPLLLPETSIFIGQPFSEYLNASQVNVLKCYLESVKPDYYAVHPRESVPILPNIPILHTRNLLIEDLVASLAQKTNIHIFGAFSSALINITPNLCKKTYISILVDSQEIHRRTLMQTAGCSVIII